MAAARNLLQTSKPSSRFLLLRSSSSSSVTTLRCTSKVEMMDSGKRLCGVVNGDDQRKSMVRAPAAAYSGSRVFETAEPQTTSRTGLMEYLLTAMLTNVSNFAAAVGKIFRPAVDLRPRPWRLLAQLSVERAIIDCRFFTLFAVAGSLVGSILCFLEGCFTIIESYLQYFQALSQRADQGDVMQLLIEALDLFLVGTAMLVFGMGLYVMFVGTKSIKEKGPRLPGSNLFGLFYLRTLPTWIETQSFSQAKSKIGHVVTLLLQVGVLEKFKSTPLVNGLDLACFAGVVLISSACIFLLSSLSTRGK
ncbi:uncharacterized protein LOC131162913 [Malania oleifera]|uniref:uncharacterized protein LOC131162913 n=1 Tax=Malania oleifera TaxID=397392 RepID=UPI0025ADE742|nr:uncharacterized protein LOC131162913 [Malania oleifera]